MDEVGKIQEPEELNIKVCNKNVFVVKLYEKGIVS